MNCQRTKEFW